MFLHFKIRTSTTKMKGGKTLVVLEPPTGFEPACIRYPFSMLEA